MVRSVLGVIAGFGIWSVLWVVAGNVFPLLAPEAFDDRGMTQSPGILAGFLFASVICSLVGGFVLALIVSRGRAPSALVLGLLLLAVGIFVQMQVWDALPPWYHLSFLILLVPVTMVGSELKRAGT